MLTIELVQVISVSIQSPTIIACYAPADRQEDGASDRNACGHRREFEIATDCLPNIEKRLLKRPQVSWRAAAKLSQRSQRRFVFSQRCVGLQNASGEWAVFDLRTCQALRPDLLT